MMSKDPDGPYTAEQSKVLNEKVTLTKLELKTIMEDAFIDGWDSKDSDWSSADAYLRHHKKFGDSSETTIAIDNLLLPEEK